MDKQKIKVLIKKIFCLSPVLTLLIAVPSFAFVIFCLTKETVPPAIAYISYALSAYAMIITITGMADLIRWIREKIFDHPVVNKVLGIPLVERYLSETAFRAEISLYPSLFINLMYAGIKLISGIYYKSVWFGTLAVYYILLALMRFSLLHHVRKRGKRQQNTISELKICRLCGMILMALDWALTGMIVLVIRKNSGFTYPGMLIYVMALYTFYTVITAFVNVIKFRKYESPAISVAKVINLTAALVSMFSLETAMLTQFGADRDADFRQMMSAVTGAGMSILVLGMAVYMIARTTNQIHKIKKTEDAT
ncbi:MAG: hypothetical protein ACI4FX_07915 [Agathobacter sp.]